MIRFSHSDASDASQMRRKQKDTGAMFSSTLESAEVSGHSADIVRDK